MNILTTQNISQSIAVRKGKKSLVRLSTTLLFVRILYGYGLPVNKMYMVRCTDI